MTNVKHEITHLPDGMSHHKVSIIGHANFDEIGKDIVCSAISILGTTLVQHLIDIDAKFMSLNFSEGAIQFEVVDTSCEQKTKTIIEVIMAGFSLLENQYPDFVKINC